MVKRRHLLTAVLSFGLSLVLLLGSGCAYFNTFYLAQRNFNDAERIRTRNNNVLDATARNAYNDAISWSSEILRSFPDSRYVDDSLFIIGMSNYHQQKYVEARTKFDELIRFFPDSDLTLTATYYKAQSLIELNQMDDAALIFNGILDSSDRELRGLAGLGLAMINRLEEDWSGLLNSAEQVLASDPQDEQYVEAVALKGEALYHLERYDEAIETLRVLKDKRITPELRFEVNSLLALATASLGEYVDAMSYLETMQNRGQFTDFEPRIRLQIGNLYEMQGDDELAIDTYTRLAGDFPDSLAAKQGWYNIGILLLRDMDNAEQARESFNKVKEGRASTGESWYVDAQIKSVQIDSLISKRELIDRLVRGLDREGRDTDDDFSPGDIDDAAQLQEPSPPEDIQAEPEDTGAPGPGALLAMTAQMDSTESMGGPDSTTVSAPLPTMTIDMRKEQLAAARFSLAELYTYSFDRPDSAMTQYRYIVEETPDSEYAIKSSYFIETYQLAEQDAFTEDADREIMAGLIERYPESQFAQDLKVYLGLIEQTPDARLFMDAEHLRLTGGEADDYIPMFQQVVDRYPRTKSAFRARFLIAYAYEHDLGDRVRAIEYYTALSEEEPVPESAEYISLAEEKLRMMEQEETLLEEIENNIAYYETVIRDLKSGLGLAATGGPGGLAGAGAAIGDITLTGLQKIRARNARIRSRYYTN